MLVEEAQRDKVEVAKQKNAEAILEKIAELEKAMAQEDANPEQGIQETRRAYKRENLGK